MAVRLDKTIVALATPQGVGAVGLIRVSGSEAIRLVKSVFRGKDLEKQPSHTIHLGTIHDNGEPVDEALVSLFRAPRSYTGEEVVEISTHGSAYIQKKIIELLVSRGAVPAGPGEFTLRAFLNKKLDLAQAEAVADMISADSEASLHTAITHIRGHFSARIKELRSQLLDFVSLVELELDFAEEDVEFANRSQLTALVNNIITETDKLVSSFRYGNVVKNGIPTVIAGRPNAGKSTLLNALLNEERAIVSEIPGTTRDTIEESIQVNGIQFRFIDTAGIRQGDSEIEAIGIQRTFEKIKQARVVLYVFDASATTAARLQEELADLKEHLGEQELVLVANKSDKPGAHLNQHPDIVYISSLNKQIQPLLDRLSSIAGRSVAPGSEVMITNARHYASLLDTRNYLEQVLQDISTGTSGELLAFNIRKALQSLGEITGEVTTDDILGNIFSRFCIGK